MTKNKMDFIEELKILVDTIEIANEFDYVPNEIEKIRKGISLYGLSSSPEEIMKYSGLRHDEVTNRMIYFIKLEYKKWKKENIKE